jgi:hypothetical protein
MALRTKTTTTTTTENRGRLWVAIATAPTWSDIDGDGPLAVPPALRDAYVAFAGDPAALDGFMDRDLRENHTSAVRHYGRALGEDVDYRPSNVVGARDRVVERDLGEIEAALAARGLSGRGLWAHSTALNHAETVTRTQAHDDETAALSAWKRTCDICATEDDTTRVRRDRVTGEPNGLPANVANANACDKCVTVALAAIATAAANETTPGGRNRDAAVTAWLAAN